MKNAKRPITVYFFSLCSLGLSVASILYFCGIYQSDILSCFAINFCAIIFPIWWNLPYLAGNIVDIILLVVMLTAFVCISGIMYTKHMKTASIIMMPFLAIDLLFSMLLLIPNFLAGIGLLLYRGVMLSICIYNVIKYNEYYR